MQNAQIIYQQTIFPLPDSEKLRLATIILQNLTQETESKVSAMDFLSNLPNEKVFENAEAVERHLKEEREDWDN
jgi:hypothetical protein